MADAAPAPRPPRSAASIPRHDLIDIFLVAGAGLLLEISYTRVISFKLFYYYTYLIIGLALLGMGFGGVAVALSPRLRAAPIGRVVAWCAGLGALGTLGSYLVVAWTPINTLDIWAYGEGRSFRNLGLLLVVCLAMFVPFAMVGVMISTFFGRRSQEVGRLYFADLIGAGLACAVVVFLIRDLGPPTAIMISGLVLAAVALGRVVPSRLPARIVPAAAAVVVLAASVLTIDSVDVRADESKLPPDPADVSTWSWSPIFRVDAVPTGPNVLLYHDGLIGSSIHEFDGDLSGLTRFDADARSFPFATLGDAPSDMMIVGAAGGHEILASLYYDAAHVDAVELNPVTHDLLTDTYADYSGNIASYPQVDYILDDGRSHLERSDRTYDLVWYPAPDSYAASSTATAGAFVLSESYLYTSEAVQSSLDKLSSRGIVAAQFGEIDFENKPNRTARYVSTVRHALEARGVAADDVGDHVLVATTPTTVGATSYSTVLVKATPFTDEEVARFTDQARSVDVELMGAQELAGQEPQSTVTIRHAPGLAPDGGPVSSILTLPDDDLDAWFDAYAFDVRPITDDGPYFWSFARLDDVARQMRQPINTVDPEAGTGERVLLLLLGIAVAFALVFLIVPFLAIRRDWRALPRKGTSAIYFACLGMGFLFFEITLIQRLTLFLGYPTYSLTVTLASILLFTGVGALLSERVARLGWRLAIGLLGGLAVLTAFYEIALPAVTDSLFDLSLAVRIAVSFVVLAPLGLLLGMFMPLGLGAVGRLTHLDREYVAWGWAVNGFASVVGSVLTTLLSMTFGFRTVMLIALAVYAVAVVALRSLLRAAPVVGTSPDGAADAAPDGAASPALTRA